LGGFGKGEKGVGRRGVRRPSLKIANVNGSFYRKRKGKKGERGFALRQKGASGSVKITGFREAQSYSLFLGVMHFVHGGKWGRPLGGLQHGD